MAAPTNISFLTATDLGALPATLSQRVDDAGTTYTVYYSFTPTTTGVVGPFALGDLSVYMPTMAAFTGPASAPTAVPSIANALNVPMQFWAESGQLYLLRVTPNAGNPSPANLTMSVEVGPTEDFPSLAIFIQDDVDPLPAATLDFTTALPVRFDRFSAGEGIEILNDGTLLTQDVGESVNAGAGVVALWTFANGALTFDEFVTVFAGSGSTFDPRQISSNQVDTFYVGMRGNGATHARIAKLTNTGVIVTTWTLPAAGLVGLVPSPDESIIYNIGQGGSSNAPIKRWDTGSSTMTTDLIATLTTPNYAVTQDLLCYADGRVIAAYVKGGHVFATAVSAAGSVLWTTDVIAENDSDFRLARIPTDPTSFIGWAHLNSGESQFFRISVDDGSIVTTLPAVPEFEAGVSQVVASLDPIRFGHAFSCGIVVLSSTRMETFPIRRQRRFLLPGSDDNKRMKIPTLELLLQGGVGLTPDAWGGSTPQGADPQVLMRISKDGGKTWGPERARTAGQIGRYLTRVRWLQATGQYRNAVCEITCSEPVDLQMIAMMGTPEEGVN